MIDRLEIVEYLNELFPDAHCELNYSNHYELLISVILSAQTTDKKVNQVTEVLFKKYPDFNSLANANKESVVQIIKPLGLSNSKATNIITCSKQVAESFNGQIPSDKNQLKTLAGVGEKVACVFLAEGLGVNEFPVDTHIKRISNRLGLSKSDNPDIVERDLKKKYKGFDWHKMHHEFIFFGRYFCKSLNPNCKECRFNGRCKHTK